ncbi:MAG: hypothetical protein RIS09_506 [Actinomycetota bacterium]
MKFNLKAKVAVAAAAAVGLAGLTLATPASSATRSTIVYVASNTMTSLNSGTPDTNLVTNSEIGYLTSMGFAYYDDKPNLVRNTTLGTFKVVKNAKNDFRVKYTLKKGRVWSDGTPIDAVDLLLSHVLSSSKYSIRAGLGNPSSATTTPVFDSLGYNGLYDNAIVANPIISKDRMSVTLKYKSFQPDWELMGPGPSPVHTLVLLSEGKKGLQSAAVNAAAKERFLKAYLNYDKAALRAMGKVWSNDYHISDINKSTNKLLLVTNGAYIVKSAVTNQSTTLVLNKRYNSGPKTNGIKKFVFRYIADGTAAAQALINGEIDIYGGQPNAASVALLRAASSVEVLGGNGAVYEHIDLRHGPVFGSSDKYTGPFAGKSQRAKDLRKAFMLTIPRTKIVNDLVKTINPNSVVMNSLFRFPGTNGYSDIVNASGVKEFTDGSQEDRTAKALALVKKYFPNAGAGSNSVKVRLLWGTPANARRASEALLIKTEAAKAGFEVVGNGVTAWSGLLDSSDYDAMFFAWVQSSTSQANGVEIFKTDGGNNLVGYSNPDLDKELEKLYTFLTPAQILQVHINAEKILMEDVVSLPIFQHPNITAFKKGLKGMKPAPLTPQTLWNFWEFSF